MTSHPKYKLNPKRKDGLRRIVYKINIPMYHIKAGDLGGLLEGYHNLSQEDNCCVCGNAIVRGDAIVGGDAIVCCYARVGDNAVVGGNAIVCDSATVRDNAHVSGRSVVRGSARVRGSASVSGNAWVCNSVIIESGEWSITPLYIELYPWSLITDTPTTIKIGCQSHTPEWWLSKESKILLLTHEVDSRKSAEYEIAIKFAAKWLKHNAKFIKDNSSDTVL